jgi:hypothetical protein
MWRKLTLKKEEERRKKFIYGDTEPQLKTDDPFLLGILNPHKEADKDKDLINGTFLELLPPKMIQSY